MQQYFASDNCSAAHPEVLNALLQVEAGHFHSYGDDPVTEDALRTIRSLFGDSGVLGVRFVLTGTAANILAITSFLRPGQTVICAKSAHINEDEGGAIEGLSGIKLFHVPAQDGKLSPKDLEEAGREIGNVHRSQPGVVSISQTSELGTLYEPHEIRAIADWAHERGLILHIDGARMGNAVAAFLLRDGHGASGTSQKELQKRANEILRAMTMDAGVDVLSLGGTKNGLLAGEGVVFFVHGGDSQISKAHEAWDRSAYLRKQLMQLASKMRYVSAQMQALYGGDLWLRNAIHANKMGLRLGERIRALANAGNTDTAGLPTPRLFVPVQANALFVVMPEGMAEKLLERHFFYIIDAKMRLARLMCSWDTREEDVDSLARDMKEYMTSKEKAW